MFFDIGANVGKWSLANITSCNKIIVVEASPTTFSNLLSNISKNPKFICLNYAVCNNNCEDVIFYDCSCHFLLMSM